MDTTTPESCKGCMLINIHTVCVLPPNFKHNKHIYNCPCQICLVKGICMKFCDSFDQYSKTHAKYIENQ